MAISNDKENPSSRHCSLVFRKELNRSNMEQLVMMSTACSHVMHEFVVISSPCKHPLLPPVKIQWHPHAKCRNDDYRTNKMKIMKEQCKM